jgi:hypothetical protein
MCIGRFRGRGGWKLQLDFAAERLGGVHADPSYAVVLVDADSVLVHDYSYLAETQTFEYLSIDPDRLPKVGD